MHLQIWSNYAVPVTFISKSGIDISTTGDVSYNQLFALSTPLRHSFGYSNNNNNNNNNKKIKMRRQDIFSFYLYGDKISPGPYTSIKNNIIDKSKIKQKSNKSKGQSCDEINTTQNTCTMFSNHTNIWIRSVVPFHNYLGQWLRKKRVAVPRT